jgi:hypothetical protein
MGRIRAIKPDFFTDDTIGSLEPDAQLLLLGLATLADKDGRLEDKPKRIKAVLFPYRDVDVEAHLSALELAGEVTRYESDDVRCVFLVHFARDQRPHPKETSFGLPPPPVKRRETSRQSVDASRRVPVVVGCGNGSGNGSLSPAVADGRAEESDLPDATEDAQPVAQSPLFAVPDEPSKPPAPDPEALRTLWNRLAPQKGLQRWEAMGDDRKRAARLSLAACPNLARWEAWLTYELARPFNLGESGWRADVDWLLRAKTRNLVLDFNPAAATAIKTATGGDVPRLGPRHPPPSPAGDKPRL